MTGVKERQLDPFVHQEGRRRLVLERQHHIWNEVESYRVLSRTKDSLVLLIDTTVIYVPLLSDVRIITGTLFRERHSVRNK
jgi:hypothetical protein